MSLRYLEGVTTLRFYPDRCIGCGRCMEVCPHGVFSWNKGSVMLQDPNACMECGACAQNCPVEAISVRTGVGCAYAVLSSLWSKRKKAKNSCCCVLPQERVAESRESTLLEQTEATPLRENQPGPCCEPAAFSRIKNSSLQHEPNSCCGQSVLLKDKAPSPKQTQGTCCGGRCC
ncbi:MAG: mercury methylation ferredoxin HgcB [Spirochaetales bacterium]